MKDFKTQDTWMVFRIMGEFVEGFDTLRQLGPAVSVFGGARFKEDHRYYQMAREVGAELAKDGYAVITGGGPGIMEAASRGASEAGGTAVGLNIKLPFEQSSNRWNNVTVDFDYFFARKVMFMRYAQAYVVLPGGFGTMDEFFEALTLIQTAKIKNFPVVLVGSEYWTGLLEWVSKTMVDLGTISEKDLEICEIVDDVASVVRVIREKGLQTEGAPKGDAEVSPLASAPRPGA